MQKFKMNFVFHFYILGLTSWIWINPSIEELRIETPSKWNSYEGFNLKHYLAWFFYFLFFFDSISSQLDHIECHTLGELISSEVQSTAVMVTEVRQASKEGDFPTDHYDKPVLRTSIDCSSTTHFGVREVRAKGTVPPDTFLDSLLNPHTTFASLPLRWVERHATMPDSSKDAPLLSCKRYFGRIFQ